MNRHKKTSQTLVRDNKNRPSSPQKTIPKSWRIIAGTHAIKEALAVRPVQVKELWLKQGWGSAKELKEIQELCLKYRNIEISDKPEAVLERFAFSHQGALLLVDGGPEFSFERLASLQQATLMVLDGIEDPHNLGAIMRTLWLSGGNGVLIPEDRAVGLTPVAHKVASGGAEHIPVEACTNFQQPIEALKEQGFWVFGLSHKAKKTIFDLKIPEKVIWAVGAEDKGLRVTTERLCDELVSLPQVSASASYNASVAAAFALFETVRSRQEK